MNSLTSNITYFVRRHLYEIIFGIFIIIHLNILNKLPKNKNTSKGDYETYQMTAHTGSYFLWIIGLFIVRLWYFSSTAYSFWSIDFMVFLIITLFTRVIAFAGLMIGPSIFMITFIIETVLLSILTALVIYFKADATFYLSTIHQPSLIAMVVCCIANIVYSAKSVNDKYGERV